MIYPKHYKKDLTHLTSIRLSNDLRQQAEYHAEYLGISFSDFVRQSLIRNINISVGIEEEINRQARQRSFGKRP